MSAKLAKVRMLRTAASADPTSFLDDYLPYLLGHASEVMNKDFDRFVKAAGLSPVEWRTLASLERTDGLTIGALCRIVVAQQPTVTKAIKRLDEIGLVERSGDADDLRKTRVFMTARGVARARQLEQAARAHEADLLRHVSATQVRALKEALRVILTRRAPMS